MDAVTRSLMKEFSEQNGFSAEDDPTLFEHFVNYLVTADSTGLEFDLESIATGSSEFGIDGIGIIVNDSLIEDSEQLIDIIDLNKILEVSFYFIQSKSTSGFDAGEILKFSKAVKDFFFDDASLNKANKRIKTLHEHFLRIYEHAAKFSRGLTAVHMYYVSTGTWKSDPLLTQLISSTETEFSDSNMFSEARVIPVDATKIQSLYFKSKNAIRAEVEMPILVPMPNIVNIRESYIGVISAKEYLNLILDEKGDIIKKVFFDNLRDFQGETEVNKSIAGTLESESASQFPLRNNGVTVVARNLNRVGNKYIIEDYQIVNGCQSSHVIAAHRDSLPDGVFCPIKIISTDDEESIKEIIISSNRQNEISSDGFWILDDIHKKLEVYFGQKDIPLFYERRNGQYNIQENIEKTKVVNKDILLKSFAAMFLAEINRVGRYYKDLLPQIRRTIFAPNHSLGPYYTSALAYWRLEFLFRARRIDRKCKAFRYPLLLIGRYMMEQQMGLDRRKALSDGYSAHLDSFLADVDKSEQLFRDANAVAELIVAEMGEEYSKRVAKMRDFKERVEAAFPAAELT